MTARIRVRSVGPFTCTITLIAPELQTSGGALIKALPEGVTIDGRGYFLKNLMCDLRKRHRPAERSD